MNWGGTAFATAIVAALSCLVTALLAPGAHLFFALLAASIAIAAVIVYAASALRDAERRIAKLSEELTVQSQRLVRLESLREAAEGAPAASLAEHVEALNQVTAALADVLDGQDARLRAIEQKDAAGPAPPAAPPEAAPPPPAATPPLLSERPPPIALTTREDFARAASAIIDRLSPDPLRVVQAPGDDAVVDELEAGRLELWLQPVVTLPQRRVRLYAGLPHLRGRDGEPLGPEAIRPILSHRNRLERLDAFVLSQSLVVAGHLAHRGRDTAIVVSLSQKALGSAAFLDGAISRLEGERAAAARLVIEIAQADAETFSAQEAAALARLRGLGAGLSIAGVPDLDQDWAAIARRGFAYAALDADIILAPRPHATTAFLVAEAARAGVSLMAIGVEREPRIPDLLDFDVPLARGSALAPPRPVRADVLAPREETTQQPASLPGDGRTSFRDFLRRAG